MFNIFFPLVRFVKKTKNLSALACHLTHWTGKSKYPLHPKHLVNIDKSWFLDDIKKSDVLLDIGCGNGQNTLKAAKKCRKIIGLDYDGRQLSIAQGMVLENKIGNIEFLNLNLGKRLPFKNNSFDKILFLDVLEHLNKRQQVLKEIKRVLRKKGKIFISVPNKETSWKKIQKKAGLNYYSDPDHKVEYSLAEIKKLLLKNGFEILEIKPVVYDTPWTGFIDLIGGFSLNLYQRLLRWKKSKLKNNLKESAGFRIKIKKN